MSHAASWQKEQFSKAYMLAVATQGGYTVGEWNVDKDGVDVTLRFRGLMVDLQLKCTQRPRVSNGDYAFDLDIPTYEKLRDPERCAPGYMALVVVPTVLDRWLLHEPERLLMSCHAYWAKLQDEPPPAGGNDDIDPSATLPDLDRTCDRIYVRCGPCANFRGRWG